MKVQILKPIPGYAYFEGNEAEIDDELAASWTKAGYARATVNAEPVVEHAVVDPNIEQAIGSPTVERAVATKPSSKPLKTKP